MNKERLLKLAGILNEDFSDAEHYKKKGAEKQKFEGRTIVVTDLYDGDVFGFLGHKRFVVSSPLWRGEEGPGHVDEDEVEVSDVDNSLSSKEVAFLKRWTLSELNESTKINEGRAGAEEWYRKILRDAIKGIVELGEDSPIENDDIEAAVNHAMEEFNKGY